jgi:hypothetical protein
MLERLTNLFLEVMKCAKKEIMNAKNVKILVGENRNNGSGNDFMDNLYDHGLSMSNN